MPSPTRKNRPLTLLIDPQHLRARLERRLAELGKTARGASREAELSESALRNIMEGKSRSPRIDTILSLAHVLEVSPDWFLESAKEPARGAALEQTKFVQNFLRDHSETLRGLDAGIYYGERIPLILPKLVDGLLHFACKPFVFIDHADLPKTNDLQYALLVRTSDMSPVYRIDDILLIDPSLELSEDEDCLFVKEHFSVGTNMARLARFKSQTDEAYAAQVFDPPSDLEMKKTDWRLVHRVSKRIKLPL